MKCECGNNHAIDIEGSVGVTLEGVTVLHATSWNVRIDASRDVHVRGLKIIGWRCWNDGIDVVSSQDVLIENVFVRSDDDGVVVKGMDPHLETARVLVRNSIIWNQRFGNCMEVGFELNNARVRDIRFERISCLHETGAVMSIHNDGRAAVENLSYHNITAETVTGMARGCRGNGCLMLFDFSITEGAYCRPTAGCSDPSRRGTIRGVRLSHVRVSTNGVPFIFSQMHGNTSRYDVRDIAFENFTVDGYTAGSLADLNTTDNDFVSGIRFGAPMLSEPRVAVEEMLA